jgi:hypothetical protein
MGIFIGISPAFGTRNSSRLYDGEGVVIPVAPDDGARITPACQLTAATARAASRTTAHRMRSMRSRTESRAECSGMKPIPSNSEAKRPIDKVKSGPA